MQFEFVEPMRVENVNEQLCLSPMHQDLQSMGIPLGRNLMALLLNFEGDECKEVIIVDRRTGERIKITPQTREVALAREQNTQEWFLDVETKS